jgi:hypothetical protein
MCWLLHRPRIRFRQHCLSRRLGAQGGKMKNDPAHQQYGYHLDLKHNGAPQFGGPLFWSHYSFLGLDPRKLKDQYADYWQHNVNHTLINYQYCVENPKGFKGYGKDNWGLTASYSVKGYAAHSPERRFRCYFTYGSTVVIPLYTRAK